MNLKEFIENNEKNIKKIPFEFAEYQKFFDFHKILWPVLEEYKLNNNEAVAIEYSLRQVIDLSNHYSHYLPNKDVVEIDLQHIFKLSNCDVIKNNLKITENLEKGENIDYELIEYNRNYNIEKNRFDDEYVSLKEINMNDSVLVLQLKNVDKKEFIKIYMTCLLFV